MFEFEFAFSSATIDVLKFFFSVFFVNATDESKLFFLLMPTFFYVVYTLRLAAHVPRPGDVSDGTHTLVGSDWLLFLCV